MNCVWLILFGVFVFGIMTVSSPASAACTAEHEGPCFDSYIGFSDEEMSQESIMNFISRNLDTNYDNWTPGDREWSPIGTPLELPAIICTSYVVNGTTNYGMMKWDEPAYVSSMERYRDDSMCDVWLSPNTNVAQEDIPLQIEYSNGIITQSVLILIAISLVPIIGYVIYQTKKK